MLNIRPKDLLGGAEGPAPADGSVTDARLARRPVPPSWRLCRLTMRRAHFLGIVGAWIGGLAIVLAVALTVRWS